MVLIKGTVMASETEYAWAAGFLDGEGSFLIVPSRKQNEAIYKRKPSIQAQQIVEKPISKLYKILGGSIIERSNTTSAGNPIWQWQIQGGKGSLEALPLLLPHLVVKRRAAELLLRYANTYNEDTDHRHGIPLEVQKERLEIWEKYQMLPSRRN